MGRKNRPKRKRLVPILVTEDTFFHLTTAAMAEGLKEPGQVVDKLMRTSRLTMKEMQKECSRTARSQSRTKESRGASASQKRSTDCMTIAAHSAELSMMRRFTQQI